MESKRIESLDDYTKRQQAEKSQDYESYTNEGVKYSPADKRVLRDEFISSINSLKSNDMSKDHIISIETIANEEFEVTLSNEIITLRITKVKEK